MKTAVLYFSQTGRTKNAAEMIAEGMNTVKGVEAKVMSISAPDAAWLKESRCVLLGTPVYYASVSAAVKQFMEGMGQYELGGKLGGAFATADYVYGGGEIALQSILTHMMFFGMMVYSGGCACGAPPIHLGPVTVKGESANTLLTAYGQRMAAKAVDLFITKNA